MIRRVTLALFILACGCNKPKIQIASTATIVAPGLGLSNTFALGMRIRDVKARCKGAQVLKYEGSRTLLDFELRADRVLFVPSYGALSHIGRDNDLSPIQDITFYVQPAVEGAIPGLGVQTPYRGKLDSLTFGSPVSKAMIEASFGPAQQTTNGPHLVNLEIGGTPFALTFGSGTEEMHYPAKGVSFQVRSNEVRSFRITPPTAKNVTPSATTTPIRPRP